MYVRPARADRVLQRGGVNARTNFTGIKPNQLKQITLDDAMSLSRLLPLRLCALLIILVGMPASAHAAVVVAVDKSTQRMSVAVDGTPRHDWAVSTGRAGCGTPSGTYAPTRLERTWFSRAYYNSPMPHSIFFHGGYAIHGSYEISRLGGPASHGCIRLHPSNAATLFSLVRRYGGGQYPHHRDGRGFRERTAASPDPARLLTLPAALPARLCAACLSRPELSLLPVLTARPCGQVCG